MFLTSVTEPGLHQPKWLHSTAMWVEAPTTFDNVMVFGQHVRRTQKMATLQCMPYLPTWILRVFIIRTIIMITLIIIIIVIDIIVIIIIFIIIIIIIYVCV